MIIASIASKKEYSKIADIKQKKLFKRECFRGRLELSIKSIAKISISH